MGENIGITWNKALLVGRVVGDPVIQGGWASINFKTQVPAPKAGGGWDTMDCVVPCLTNNEKTIEIISNYVKDERQLILDGYFNSWNGGSGIIINNPVKLGSTSMGKQNEQGGQAANIGLTWNKILLLGRVVGEPTIQGGWASLNLRTQVPVQKAGGGWDTMDCMVSCLTDNARRVETIQNYVHNERHLLIEGYVTYLDSSGLCTMINLVKLGSKSLGYNSQSGQGEQTNRFPNSQPSGTYASYGAGFNPNGSTETPF